MQESSLFIGIPLHDGRVHAQTMAGCLQSMVAFRDRIKIVQQGGSFLPRNRDILTRHFLDSPATHMLCVDSDIGWAPDDVQALLDTGKDFVSGCYAKKQPNRQIPAGLLSRREGQLIEASYVPGGFLLLSRPCVERMVGAYRDLAYRVPEIGTVWALWASIYDRVTGYDGEDVAFCRRWRDIGGEIWLHSGVILRHFGELCYVPDPLE